jgi:hypothetical protein
MQSRQEKNNSRQKGKTAKAYTTNANVKGEQAAVESI